MRWISACLVMSAAAPACAATSTASVTVEILPAIGLQADLIEGRFPQTRLIAPGSHYFWVNGKPVPSPCEQIACRQSQTGVKQLIIDMP
jgi:uncharacterized Zn-binding protein involved in type VI secretion